MITLAIQIALKAHKNKKRKGTEIPYAVHPIEVGIILAKNKMSDEIIISGIIHDAVEESFLSLSEVEELFGTKVKSIVEKMYLEDKYTKGENFKVRKMRTLDFLRKQASPEFKFVTCADRLSNIKMMEDEYKLVGECLWKRYDETYEDRKWYYHNLVPALSHVSTYPMYTEFVDRVIKVFGEIPASAFIIDDLNTIEDRYDIEVAEQSTWLTEHMVSFLGKIIEHFEITKDENIDESIKEVMNKITMYYNKQINGEEYKVLDEDWKNTIKIFYILRKFFKFNNKWIKQNLGINYLGWYKLYDERFRFMS